MKEDRMIIIDGLIKVMQGTNAYSALKCKKGYLDYTRKYPYSNRPVFVEKSGDIFAMDEPCLLLLWEGQRDQFGSQVPGAATSGKGIIESVVEAARRM